MPYPVAAARNRNFGAQAYTDMIPEMFGASLVAYWPMDDASGTTARDASGNNRTGTYIDCTLAQPGIGDGKTSVLFTNSFLNCYGAALAAAWPGSAGTFGLWLKPADAGVWTDGVTRWPLGFRVSGGIGLYWAKNGLSQIQMTYAATATQTYNLTTPSNGWMFLCTTWDKAADEVKHYKNGVQLGSTLTGLGDWTGALLATASGIGASWNTPSDPWSGWGAHGIVASRAATLAEVVRMTGNYYARQYKFTFIGDSITAAASSFADQVPAGYPVALPNSLGYEKHAAGGDSILDEFAGHVTTSADDNADIIIIALGSNDPDEFDEDLPTITGIITTGIDDLRSTNPNATIYWMNVLPRFDGNTYTQMRATIAAACASRGVTCWDTVTDPWIDQADTSDNIHPTAGGHTKILNRILGLLPAG